MKLPILAAAVLVCLALQPVRAGPEVKGDGKGGGKKGQDFTAEQAAETPRRQTGGRVLNVKPGNGGYRVKVLTPKGEVLYVPVKPPRR
jgi:hypothetical protein